MNSKFKELRNTINFMKKKGTWNPDTTWAENAWDLVLFDKYKTKQISLNEFIISSINSLFEKYNPNFKKPLFDGSIVPTWYDHENKNEYKIKLIQWFLRTIVFPDMVVWNDSSKDGVIILPPYEYIWSDEADHMYNELLKYYGLTE